ncbi:unnamed protein product, partial [Discosporangium mesarthrocarpum]
CLPCLLSKSAQVTHLKVGSSKEYGILGPVSIYLQGPFTASSMSRARYVCSFSEKATRIKFVYFVSQKPYTQRTLADFLKFRVIPTGLRVQLLHSDNGGECFGDALRAFVASHGITQRFSSPYTPRQHIISDRGGGKITAMTRCPLVDSGLAANLWTDLYATLTRRPQKDSRKSHLSLICV